MTECQQKIHICDDWIGYQIADLQIIHAVTEYLRSTADWIEVVGGLNSIAVQFDSGKIEPDQAATKLVEQISQLPEKQVQERETVDLPACYDPVFAPDLRLVSDALGISMAAIADWHSQLSFTVTMLGFMPGFAYLKCDQEIPEIGRLSQPRRNVAAGSIGIIGDQSCIYSFESPGGWPIIGRTPANLFTKTKHSAALLSAGQKIRFVPIGPDKFSKQR